MPKVAFPLTMLRASILRLYSGLNVRVLEDGEPIPAAYILGYQHAISDVLSTLDDLVAEWEKTE